MKSTALFWAVFASTTNANFFTNIIRGIERTSDGARFFNSIASDTLSSLENDGVAAGTFVCDILAGDVEGAAELVGEEVVEELEDDFNAIVGFVEDLPNIAEDVLNDIVNGVEEGVSIIGEFFTNIDGAFSAIASVGEGIASDIVGVATEIGCDLGIGDCTGVTSTAGIFAQISSSCDVILANPSYISSAYSSMPAAVYASTTYAYSSSSYAYSASPTAYSSYASPTPMSSYYIPSSSYYQSVVVQGYSSSLPSMAPSSAVAFSSEPASVADLGSTVPFSSPLPSASTGSTGADDNGAIVNGAEGHAAIMVVVAVAFGMILL